MSRIVLTTIGSLGDLHPKLAIAPELEQFLAHGEPPLVFTLGSAAVTLRAGRPTLVVPYSHDQPDNAARVARLGTSQTLPRSQYVAERAVRQLSPLLDNPTYAAKAAEIGQIIRAETGVRSPVMRLNNFKQPQAKYLRHLLSLRGAGQQLLGNTNTTG